MKILITGAGGWLGQILCKVLLDSKQFSDVDVYGCYHNRTCSWIPEDHRFPVDLCDAQGIDKVIRSILPDAVIHLAAISAPSACEKDRASAYATNCPIAIIHAIQRYCPRSLFIYTSTDLVFDGEKGSAYLPTDTPNPETMYGKSKQSFEDPVINMLEFGIVFRLSNMIGPSYTYEHVGTKFFQFLYDACMKKSYIGLRDDEIRSFVYVHDVVALIIRAIQQYQQKTGFFMKSSYDHVSSHEKIFHVGGPVGLSRLDLATILIQNLPNQHVIIHPTAEPVPLKPSPSTMNIWIVHRSSNAESILVTGIKNPRNVTMDSSYTEQVFGFKFTNISYAIAELINGYQFS